MHRMGAPPNVIRCNSHHPKRPTDPVIQPTTAEERAVTAVVLNNEQPHKKQTVENRQGASQKVAERQTPKSKPPDSQKWRQGDEKLEHASGMRGLSVIGKNADPHAGVFAIRCQGSLFLGCRGSS